MFSARLMLQNLNFFWVTSMIFSSLIMFLKESCKFCTDSHPNYTCLNGSTKESTQQKMLFHSRELKFLYIHTKDGCNLILNQYACTPSLSVSRGTTEEMHWTWQPQLINQDIWPFPQVDRDRCQFIWFGLTKSPWENKFILGASGKQQKRSK